MLSVHTDTPLSVRPLCPVPFPGRALPVLDGSVLPLLCSRLQRVRDVTHGCCHLAPLAAEYVRVFLCVKKRFVLSGRFYRSVELA